MVVCFATGCITLIHYATREVEAVRRPWFDDEGNPIRRGSKAGERTMTLAETVLLSVSALGVLITGPLLAASLFRQRRKRNRIERGECVRCGYPLTGIDSARCPECGHDPDAGD